MEISIGSFPGFKFSPTEEELILYYLKKKIEGFDKCVEIIAEVDITQFEPWDLPAKSVIQSENEWFFFSARGRKYPRGLQSRRATESGYWKATGKERNVKKGLNIIGTKRTLVFHRGRAPKGERTEWIMHEYCMSGTSQDSLVVCRLRRNCEFHFHDTPRNESRHSPTEDGSMSAVADGFQQKGVDCSSSDNSHSVDRIDSECENDHKPADQIFQEGFGGSQKDCDGADDCFADILNDDIVKLDESSLSTILPQVTAARKIEAKFKEKVEDVMPGTLPFQGTANRRIRLNRQEVKNYLVNMLEESKVGDGNFSGVAGTSTNSTQSPGCLLTTMSNMASNHQHAAILVILSLLVVFVSLVARFWNVKDFDHSSSQQNY